MVFLASALLKLVTPPNGCGPSPWEPANSSMLAIELPMGLLIASKGHRSLGALLGCGTMVGAALFLSAGHYLGWDVHRCGCFGPIEMSYGAHLAVIAVLFGLCFAILLGAQGGSATATPPVVKSDESEPAQRP